MRINTQLRIISTATIAALVILAPFLIWAFIEFNSAKNDFALGDKIEANFFERASFRDNYFLYREDRVQTQWDANKGIADDLVHQAEAQLHGDGNLLALKRLRRNLEESAVIFHRIANSTAALETAGGNRPVYEELVKRLSSQLLLKDRVIRDAATALQDASARRVELAYKHLTLIVGLFAITLALATILASMHLGRLMRKRLAPLHDGAEIVAAGDLGYRIKCGGADEFSELAQSINTMTDKLQVSSGRLEADLLELKRAESALQASEERWKFALEGAGDGVWDWNPQTDEALLSRQWKEMVGYAEDEFPNTGAAWVEHLHPEDKDRVLSAIQDHFDGKQPLYVVEFRMRCKDGSWKWLMSRGKVVNRDAHGNPLRMIGTQSDITERKRAEKYLRINSSVFDNSYQAIVISDANNIILDANLAFAQIAACKCRDMTGNDVGPNPAFEQMTLNDILGKKISEAIPGILESCPELFEAYGRAASSGKQERLETHMPGSDIWFSVSVYSPEPGCFVSIFNDVTERIRNEQELIVLNNHLTHEVAKRTSDLSSLTAHIQKIAETERASLARELHDELGSTLVGMSMGIGRLKGKVSASDLLCDLSSIKDLLTDATQIKQRIIDQLYPTVLDHHGFSAAVVWLSNEYRRHSENEVELFLPQEQIEMEQTFSLAAYRITQECLTNIAKHAEASKVRIEAKTSNGFLDLSIHDNGKGLPAERSNRCHGIFGMIERARYLGGSMKIGSEEGKGTTAHLRLPLAAAKPKSKKRVLVVDDHAIVRNALRQLLDSQTDDFSVEGEAADGKAGIQMAIDKAWDIMLLDISLPKKNGIKVLEAVIAAKPGLPIIMLSSHAKDEYGEIAMSKGAACYVEKGETDKLVEEMRRATMLQ